MHKTISLKYIIYVVALSIPLFGCITAPVLKCTQDENAAWGRTFSNSVRKQLHYPRVAMARGQEGTSILRVSVGDSDIYPKVTLLISSGNPILDNEAINAATNTRTEAPTCGGHMASIIAEVPISFKLQVNK